jgi:hypothetical protein
VAKKVTCVTPDLDVPDCLPPPAKTREVQRLKKRIDKINSFFIFRSWKKYFYRGIPVISELRKIGI